MESREMSEKSSKIKIQILEGKRIKHTIPTKERIVNVSRHLFLKQGYGDTGLNQIVLEAQTVKASLYQHFKSKEALGISVLKAYSSDNLKLLDELMGKYPNPIDFVNAWVRILKREAKRNTLFGCPMANLRSQISETAPDLLISIQETTQSTVSSMEKYFKRAQELGYTRKKNDYAKLAKQLFIFYEGVLQLWRLSGDVKSLDELSEIVEAIII
jgi:AcrR family transcriptional regulator